MTDRPAVKRTVRIDATPEVVWAALTDPLALSSWFGGSARLAAHPGGTGRFVTDDGEVRLAVVEEIEPARRLVFSWWPLRRPDGAPPGPHDRSRVTIELDPDEDGTVVVVEERAVPATTGLGPRLSPRPSTRPSGSRRGLQASATRPASVARA
jgi:uncharacterized protein YndB with AHSA1/START domain